MPDIYRKDWSIRRARKNEVDRFVAQLSALGLLPNDRLLKSTSRYQETGFTTTP